MTSIKINIVKAYKTINIANTISSTATELPNTKLISINIVQAIKLPIATLNIPCHHFNFEKADIPLPIHTPVKGNGIATNKVIASAFEKVFWLSSSAFALLENLFSKKTIILLNIFVFLSQANIGLSKGIIKIVGKVEPIYAHKNIIQG